MRIVIALVSLWLCALILAPAAAGHAQSPGTAPPDERPALHRGPLDAGAQTPSAKLLERLVSLDLRDARLEVALEAIDRQAGLGLTYTRRVVPLDRRITLRLDSVPARTALDRVLAGTGVEVMVTKSGQIVLVRRAADSGVEQAGAVVGRVTDAKTGEGLVGAEVVLEGLGRRTATGEDGRYRLADVAPGSYTLAIRRIGYGRRTLAVTVADGEEVTVDVALEAVPTQLDEVVTTVTGEQRLRELGHVVGRINADSLVKEAPVSSLGELLTGRVPGLQVSQTQGTVGGRVQLQVRGPNSVLINNQPIVIVDGVRYTTSERDHTLFGGGPGDVEPSSPLNDINVNDIESVEVVKGPSAATLYGTDAANGVIVVTTKRGRPGPARWNVYAKGTKTEIPTPSFPDTYWGWGTVFGVPDNVTQSCTLVLVAFDVCTQQDSVTVLPNPLNDPSFTMFGSKPRWEYGANVAGGRQDLRYYFSADFEDATGPIQMPAALADALMAERGLSELPEEWREPNTFTKLNLRSNVTAMLGERADVRVSTGYVRSSTRTLSRTMDTYLTQFASRPGAESPYGTSFRNPADAFAQSSTERTDRFFGNANGQWRPASWLALRATLGLDLVNSRHYALVRPGDQPNHIDLRDGAVEDSRARQIATTAELGATATARRGRLSARTAAGVQYVRNLYDASGSYGLGLPPGGSVVERALTIFSRQQYLEDVVLGGYVEEMLGLNDRLFLTGALRFDGASTFGRDYEAVVYPKVGASWLLSEEPFLPQVPGLGELRLRYAFGASGKQPYPTWARPFFIADRADLNGERVTTVQLFGLGNPDLRPERVREHEFGFDLTGLANRVALDFTWFRRRTIDQIISEDGPPGRNSLFTNLGLTTQRGFEARVNARVVDTRLLSWDVALQHANYTTKLVELGSDAMDRSRFGGYVEGYPLGARFATPMLGFTDTNGDGIIVFEELQLPDSAVYMGESMPPRSQTLSTVVGLFDRRLRLSALLERRSGFTQINALYCRQSTCRAATDPATPLAEQAEVVANLFLGVAPEKADFTRLREVTAALDLPAGAVRALHLRSATVALSARNVALWTDFSGPDPESGSVNTGAFGIVAGGEAIGFPQGRVFSVRLDLGL